MSSVKKTNREILDTILFEIKTLSSELQIVKNEVQYIKCRIINEKLKQEQKEKESIRHSRSLLADEETHEGWRFFG